MTINLDRSFRDYLKELERFNLIFYALNLQEYVVEIYEQKGFDFEQVCELPLKEVWSLIQSYEHRSKGEIWINPKTKTEKKGRLQSSPAL